jgi:hypothetical protein
MMIKNPGGDRWIVARVLSLRIGGGSEGLCRGGIGDGGGGDLGQIGIGGGPGSNAGARDELVAEAEGISRKLNSGGARDQTLALAMNWWRTPMEFRAN